MQCAVCATASSALRCSCSDCHVPAYFSFCLLCLMITDAALHRWHSDSECPRCDLFSAPKIRKARNLAHKIQKSIFRNAIEISSQVVSTEVSFYASLYVGIGTIFAQTSASNALWQKVLHFFSPIANTFDVLRPKAKKTEAFTP